jgi:hypothetical protein
MEQLQNQSQTALQCFPCIKKKSKKSMGKDSGQLAASRKQLRTKN